jgi:hypothetical protein
MNLNSRYTRVAVYLQFVCRNASEFFRIFFDLWPLNVLFVVTVSLHPDYQGYRAIRSIFLTLNNLYKLASLNINGLMLRCSNTIRKISFRLNYWHFASRFYLLPLVHNEK